MRPAFLVQVVLPRRAILVPPVALRSTVRSSGVGQSSDLAKSGRVHAGGGSREGTSVALGASSTKRTRAVAKGVGARDEVGKTAPPEVIASALATRLPKGPGSTSGSGQGKPCSKAHRWTTAHPSSRGEGGRSLTTTRRAEVSSTPTTVERWPVQNSPSLISEPKWRRHQALRSASSTPE